MVSFFKQKGQMKKRKKQKIDEKEKDQSIIKTPQNIDSSISQSGYREAKNRKQPGYHYTNVEN
nr:hypothetical protein [Peribacillus simplex]